MRVTRADISHSYHLHKMLIEFLRDTKQDYNPHITEWLRRFADPSFFCFVGMHGKQAVCMAWGVVTPFNEKNLTFEGIFVRRKFRGRFHYMRPLVLALKAYMKDNKISKITAYTEKSRPGFKLSGMLAERDFTMTKPEVQA